MLEYKDKFIDHFRIKKTPNSFEIGLFDKTKKYLKYISWIPGLKMVGVCNTLSMYCTKPTSDIDLFIVTAKKRTWLVRFLITTIFYILGVWRKDESNSAENFCLSFFINEDNLDLSKMAIENDVYLYFWIYYMKPVLNVDNTYEKFIENNKKLGIDMDDLPKDRLDYMIDCRETFQRNACTWIIEKFWDFIDFLGYFLYTRIFRFLSPKAKNVETRHCLVSTGVIISREILKFHDMDKREEIRDEILF